MITVVKWKWFTPRKVLDQASKSSPIYPGRLPSLVFIFPYEKFVTWNFRLWRQYSLIFTAFHPRGLAFIRNLFLFYFLSFYYLMFFSLYAYNKKLTAVLKGSPFNTAVVLWKETLFLLSSNLSSKRKRFRGP